MSEFEVLEPEVYRYSIWPFYRPMVHGDKRNGIYMQYDNVRKFFKIRNDLGENVNIFGSDNLCHHEKKKFKWTCVLFRMVTDIQLFGLTLDFCLWDWLKIEVYKRKDDRRDKLLARILDAAGGIKKREDQLRRKHAVLAHELQSALRLTVGFSNIYCYL
jgi:hypothetical protein